MKAGSPWYFSILTFGCKVNQYESQSLRESWLSSGGTEQELLFPSQEAENLTKNLEISEKTPLIPHLVFFNSCAVTAQAVADVRQSIMRVRKHYPAAIIMLSGCATAVPSLNDELGKALAEIDHFIPQKHKEDLLNNPQQFLFDSEKKGQENTPQNALKNTGEIAEERIIDKKIPIENNTFPAFSITRYQRARPVIKVQDGCTQACTYCIVPIARGKSRSRPFKDVYEEAQRLLHSGAREIMLSGINLRQYHNKKDGLPSFWDLLHSLDEALAPEWQGKARLRLSSLDPAQINQQAIDCLTSSKLVCPHLHLSLQSGSEKVLARMGRSHYNPQEIPEILYKFNQIWPLMGLGLDMLMGFAGEDEKALEESLALIEKLPISYAHVFAYSERPNTAAAIFTDHLQKNTRQEHARIMREAVAKKQEAFLKKILQCKELIIAPDGQNTKKGVSEHYITCILNNDHFKNKELQKTQPTSTQKKGLVVQKIIG